MAFTVCSNHFIAVGSCFRVDTEERQVSCHLICIHQVKHVTHIILILFFLALSFLPVYALKQNKKKSSEFHVIDCESEKMLRIDVW